MLPKKYSFVGIGNAAVDIICSVPDNFLSDLNLPRSSCAFPDEAGIKVIEKEVERRGIKAVYEPGGSAGNTAVTMAALNDNVAFLSAIGNDHYGQKITAAFDRWKVAYPIPVFDTASTHLYAFIAPNLDRTFAVYQGAIDQLLPKHLPADVITNSKCVYVDGYLLASKHGFETAMAALKIAKDAKVMCVFNPSALSVIATWGDQLRQIMAMCDGIICNDQEADMLTGQKDLEEAARILAKDRQFAAVTLAADGAIACKGAELIHLPNPTIVRPFVNTNGAGDNFAGGFLYGFTRDFALQNCVSLGLACAVNVLGETGPRPSAPLTALLPAA